MKNADHQAWDGDRDCSFVSEPSEDGLMVSSDLDARGRELPDPIPTAPPIGYSSGPSLADFVQRMIRSEVSKAAADAEMETFDEADDFDVDDEIDPQTTYEEYFDPRVKMGSYDPRYKVALERWVEENKPKTPGPAKEPPKAPETPTGAGGRGGASPLAADPPEAPLAAPPPSASPS